MTPPPILGPALPVLVDSASKKSGDHESTVLRLECVSVSVCGTSSRKRNGMPCLPPELEEHIKYIEEELKALRAANGGRMTRMSSMPQLIKEGVGDDAATSSTKAKGGGGGDDGVGEADDKQSTAEDQI